jgi:TldD protein
VTNPLLIDLAEKGVRDAERFGASYVDARAEQSVGTMIRQSNDVLDQTSKGVMNGFGIRALVDGAWGFSSTVLMTREAVSESARKAVSSAKAVSSNIKERVEIENTSPSRDSVKFRISQNPSDIEIARKMRVPAELVKAARAHDQNVVSASSVYLDGTGQAAIATSDGTCVEMESCRILFSINAVAKSSGRLVSAREFEGTREGFEFFDRIDLLSYAKRASQRALSLLKAKPAPSGRYKVVMDPELAGTFVHEAVGHACEADLVISGESILQDMLGRKIGSELVTICDDPTMENGWGSYKYDDEGVKARKRVLVEKGILAGFITSKETSAKLGTTSNGGARADSYAARPIVRMSNTYLSPGDYSVDELFEKVDSGIYVKGTRGGQVDTSKGTFQFSAEESYMIAKGKLTTPLLDVSLSGMTLETLNNVEAIAKDIKFNPGFCGKAYQSVPAGDGAPHFLARNVVVGGRL